MKVKEFEKIFKDTDFVHMSGSSLLIARQDIRNLKGPRVHGAGYRYAELLIADTSEILYRRKNSRIKYFYSHSHASFFG